MFVWPTEAVDVTVEVAEPVSVDVTVATTGTRGVVIFEELVLVETVVEVLELVEC